jgi:radical SAM protein with 4Fe4S-binding SPASM domain
MKSSSLNRLKEREKAVKIQRIKKKIKEVPGVGSLEKIFWGEKDGEKYPIPFEVSIEVTHNCPFSCLMCSSGSPSKSEWNKEKLEGELSFDALLNVVDEISQLGTKYVSWSGGEMILLENSVELLKYAHKKGLKNLVYTNGVVWGKEKNSIALATQEKLAEVAKFSDRIALNIQGENSKVVDYIMGRKGAFNIIKEAAMIFKSNTNTKWVEGQFVPMKPNFKHIEATVNYWLGREKLDRISFLRFVPQGEGEKNKELLELSPQQLFEAIRTIEKLQREYGKERIRIGRPLNFNFIINPNEQPYSCRAGLDAPLIQPKGRIDACPAWKMLPEEYAIGYVDSNGKGLIEAWIHSPVIKKVREINTASPEKLKEILTGSCLTCKFFASCRGRCIAQRIRKYGDMYITPDPQCPLIELHDLKSVASKSPVK